GPGAGRRAGRPTLPARRTQDPAEGGGVGGGVRLAARGSTAAPRHHDPRPEDGRTGSAFRLGGVLPHARQVGRRRAGPDRPGGPGQRRPAPHPHLICVQPRRSSTTVMSGGAPTRTGGPQKPAPRVTYIFVFPRW